ncbi:MAG TPA: STAS domain-containing protein [Spirochaetota bacterium]|nr:STAS domain-containing protein [Spirochaetota bacterium]
MESVLSVGIKGDTILIRAVGEMRAGNCFALNQHLVPYLEKKDSPLNIIIDLGACDYMDSTFIGFIISLEHKCRSAGCGGVTILRPTERSRAVLRKLSALQRLRIDITSPPPDIPVFAIQADSRSFGLRQNVELMFEAHECLGELSEENRRQFRDLLDELRRVVEKK